MVGMDQNPVQNDSSFTNTKVTSWKTNNEDKSNQCNQCQYATPRASHLRTHLLTHSGEKPHKCSQCEYASFTAGNLRNI